MINVADSVIGSDGRTWRQQNEELQHNIPIGTLVEVVQEIADGCHEGTVRAYVVQHDRDCDGTPLYSLSFDKDDTEQKVPGFANLTWKHGYSEESLRVVRIPMYFDSKPISLLGLVRKTIADDILKYLEAYCFRIGGMHVEYHKDEGYSQVIHCEMGRIVLVAETEVSEDMVHTMREIARAIEWAHTNG